MLHDLHSVLAASQHFEINQDIMAELARAGLQAEAPDTTTMANTLLSVLTVCGILQHCSIALLSVCSVMLQLCTSLYRRPQATAYNHHETHRAQSFVSCQNMPN